ncbi:methyltransferase domain-containing protein [Pendulispora rubella]|uniref:Methyltransferase domain-containing protein n=1 Tax=Pendulispora rubella TaxID=2741070 RepID=A0ABZ2KS18_9BACT
MGGEAFSARALLSLLFNASKGLDVVKTALELGILARLDRGPATLGELAHDTGSVPLRLYKLLDALETLGFVAREDAHDADAGIESTRYTAREPLEAAARAVLGETSIERDRDTYPWRVLENKLPATLRGEHHVPRDAFDWPPSTPTQHAQFEASMAAGVPPIAEAFRTAHDDIFVTGSERWLDVGGGDGALAASVLTRHATLTADVLNLAITEPLVRGRAEGSGVGARLGFVAGDFLNEEFPRGYDVISFVRVLHDWPAATARMLLDKATRALAPGGRLVVCEEFRTPDRLAIQFFWTYFLIGVDSCVSRLREIDFYVRELEARGYRDIRTRRGPFDVLVAMSAK